ncbi:phosphotransferase enzyme family protein [Pedobacter boryungensis]|uniref:Aminoglycoside phosphotransferase family protein n=1 Tax=Pedobacter boryungensis TaxID=869962 RepID=A0ABX2DDP2_9SPHI|nr:aminoglycoside phosphotransferase family protein [Pedobacter boryungensis]NQX32204.1 aminoglycoside phosphotransferase family protein [Pedobacter boryungensis]
MELSIAKEIIEAYGFTADNVSLQQIGSGHINRTYLLSSLKDNKKYILQNVNAEIFKDPSAIANNIKIVADYLKTHSPEYLFPAPITTLNGDLMAHYNNEYWRLLPFVDNTLAFDTLSDTKQAYEAAKQFGKLSRLLNEFNTSALTITIPGFHDLAWRYEQFTFALNEATINLKANPKEIIETALHYHFIVDYFRSFEHSKEFPDRVMHHDTKISNVLLNASTNIGVCVIDLDTLMPGKFISDLGDMIRTYICAFSENETDLNKVKIRLPYFEATVKGYLAEMSTILTPTEKELILFSGKYIVYMQALRFLTDYLNGNIYYPITYATQNLDRAKNQFKLLSELFENEKILQGIIDECLS